MLPRTPQNRTVKRSPDMVRLYRIAAKPTGNGNIGDAHRGNRLERNLFAFVLRHSKRDQLLIVPLVFASMDVYYLSLDLPKMIINEPIQGNRDPEPDSS